ncbi:MAG: hypothetical protein E7464_07115 [Ruminococcaceae bacterium]|nr:hypothetical protein [Oscillospiraceae bacterium]
MQKNQRMKCFVVATLCLMLLFSITACGKGPVYLVEEQSCFLDFTVDGETVEFRCHLCIQNELSNPQKVSLTGHFSEDMEAGLIQEESLLASDPEVPESTTFLLQPGLNTLDVVFTGTFGGNHQKQDRLLPEISIEIH